MTFTDKEYHAILARALKEGNIDVVERAIRRIKDGSMVDSMVAGLMEKSVQPMDLPARPTNTNPNKIGQEDDEES